jgi:hypothetical protein
MDKFMQRVKIKRLFFAAGILLVSVFGWFLLPPPFHGAGSAALACCYDPPSATITPDAPSASSEPSTPDSDMSPSTPASEKSTKTDAAGQADDETPPPPSLAEMLLQPARKAIASGEWLKAQIIVDAAQGRLGAEPELQRLKAEINTHFGLAAPQASPLVAPPPFMTGKLQALASSSDPLNAALSELGAGRSLP